MARWMSAGIRAIPSSLPMISECGVRNVELKSRLNLLPALPVSPKDGSVVDAVMSVTLNAFDGDGHGGGAAGKMIQIGVG